MYYVYRLTFGGYEYIGCTNNIRRRKDQHNANARNGKSKLGEYLQTNGITLKTDDFQIVATHADRSEALNKERSIAIDAEASGARLLNDNYSRDCTRKGKNIGNTAKEYTVVDYRAHTATTVNDLRQYCIKHGLNYKSVQRTVKPGHYSESGVKAFYADEWARESDKDKYLSGAFVEEIRVQAREKKNAKTSKSYVVRFPDGHTETVKNLDKFAREHCVNAGNLHASYTTQKPASGYQVLRRI